MSNQTSNANNTPIVLSGYGLIKESPQAANNKKKVNFTVRTSYISILPKNDAVPPNSASSYYYLEDIQDFSIRYYNNTSASKTRGKAAIGKTSSRVSDYVFRVNKGDADFSFDDKSQIHEDNAVVFISAIAVSFQDEISVTSKWKQFRTGAATCLNFLAVFLVILCLMGVLAFVMLNSLGALPGSLTSFVGGISGTLVLVIPLLSISSLSGFVTARWKLLNKGASTLLAVLIILTGIFCMGIPTWEYLVPLACPSPPYPSYPAFLAGSQYIAPQELYQKVVVCSSKSSGDELNLFKNRMNWDGGSKAYPNPNCTFSSNNDYKVTATPTSGLSQDGVQPCFFHAFARSDFVYQVSMQVAQNTNKGGGGLVFRASDPHKGQIMYRTDINVTGYGPQTQSYNFFLIQDEPCHLKSVSSFPHPFCTDPMLVSGAGAKNINILTVIVFGTRVYFYINGSYADQANSDISGFGYFGVFANANGGPSDIIFSDAKEWDLWL